MLGLPSLQPDPGSAATVVRHGPTVTSEGGAVKPGSLAAGLLPDSATTAATSFGSPHGKFDGHVDCCVSFSSWRHQRAFPCGMASATRFTAHVGVHEEPAPFRGPVPLLPSRL